MIKSVLRVSSEKISNEEIIKQRKRDSLEKRNENISLFTNILEA